VDSVNSVRPHVSEEQLAAFVEGGLPAEEAENLRGHLGSCRLCMAAYADTVRLRGTWRGEVARAEPGAIPTARIPAWRDRRVLVAACLPLLVAAGAWLALTGTSGPAADHQAVLALVARASHHGPILPGAGSAAWDPLPINRSGRNDTSSAADMRAALLDLRRSDRDSWAALEIAGHLALDDLRMADIRVERELDEGNEHPDLLLAAGVLRYRQSRLEESRGFLERVLAARPADPVARFNLALVQKESGQEAAAREAFAALAAMDDRPLISHRARLELAGLPDLPPAE